VTPEIFSACTFRQATNFDFQLQQIGVAVAEMKE
jgi:hypothetical protein